MKEFFKNFIDGFLSALLMISLTILIVIILLAPLALAAWYNSGWWLIVWVVDLCVGHGIANSIQ